MHVEAVRWAPKCLQASTPRPCASVSVVAQVDRDILCRHGPLPFEVGQKLIRSPAVAMPMPAGAACAHRLIIAPAGQIPLTCPSHAVYCRAGWPEPRRSSGAGGGTNSARSRRCCPTCGPARTDLRCGCCWPGLPGGGQTGQCRRPYREAVDALNVETGALIALPIGLILAYGLPLMTQVFGELRDALFAGVGQNAIRTVALHTFKHLHNLSLGSISTARPAASAR